MRFTPVICATLKLGALLERASEFREKKITPALVPSLIRLAKVSSMA